eukprot:TRINITY_DN5897_c0_g1_i1.p1 TRINITY_DN5897_c0_g1~~TRINITY_DN5897_c0_g1_i1.p1  ORF type:complete len:582 (-),score=92.20 TRINITY_DN5897_c0_g1_i1:1576-3321(-)
MIRIFFYLCLTVVFQGGYAQKSLYSSNDSVVELSLEEESRLASPDKIYIVEFYAHWCGHCIRYSPFWKNVASIFKPWGDSVVIAAINCAERDCAVYDIPGTPTIKVFKPFNNVPEGLLINTNKRLVLHDIYEVIKEVRSEESADPKKYPDLSPFRGGSIMELKDEVSSYDKSILLFKELPEFDWSELVVIIHSQGSPYKFKIIDPKLRDLSRSLNITSRPAVAIVDWMDRSKDKIFLVDLSSYSSTLNQVSLFLKKNIYSGITLDGNHGGIEGDDNDDTESLSENLNLPDVVYEGDLEKVVKYMLSVEIPMYSLEDNSRFLSLRHFLGTLLRYLPLRKEIITTILELRNWLDETPDISEEDYKSKLNELKAKNKPFRHTPSDWKGCKGSTPYFRGYPCGVWTLFHVLSVEAMNTEESELSQEGPTRVTLSIMEYIKYFFSCRNCAENFMKKVDSIGYLPSAPETTVVWIWRIHNMANIKLHGDPTEDPEHVKTIWPSSQNCPNCRDSDGDLITLNPLQKWNQNELLAYIVSVYGGDSIQRIPESNSDTSDPEEDLVDDIMSGSLNDRDIIRERLRKYCSDL